MGKEGNRVTRVTRKVLQERKDMEQVTLTLNERRYRIGESHHRAKLTDDQVDQMRELHEEQGVGYRTLAKQFNVSKRTVRDIVHYKTRAQTPEFWVKAKGGAQ